MIRILWLVLLTVLVMASFVPILFVSRCANTMRLDRRLQLFCPVLAVLFALIVATDLDVVNSLFLSAHALFARLIPILSLQGALAIYLFANMLYVCVFTVGKAMLILVSGILERKFPSQSTVLCEWAYVYGAQDGLWFLRDDRQGLREIARYMFIAASVLGCALTAIVFFGMPGFEGLFYPSAGIVVASELYYFLQGKTNAEFAGSMTESADASVRFRSFSKILVSLLKTKGLSKSLLYNTSYKIKQLPSDADMSFCSALVQSSEFNERLAGYYFSSLLSHGVLSEDESSKYGPLERAAVMSAVRLLEGQSVLFASPFYHDYAPYVFLPVNELLAHNLHAVVLHGSSTDSACVYDYVVEGLELACGVEGLWDCAPLTEGGGSRPDVATLTFLDMSNIRLLMHNEGYLRSVGMVIIIDANNLLATCPVALDYFAGLVNEGEPCTYCVFDRNTDGLVDALSHALRTSIVEVNATTVGHGLTIGAFWDADEHAMQKYILPGVTKYLGVGPTIGAIALKGQVPQVGWVGRDTVPLADQRWILSQYFKDVFEFAELPQDQEQLDRYFSFHVDPSGVRKQTERFLMVEDEYNNLFEAFRQYASRGMRESFVNVLSASYMLRDYMIGNPGVFERDPKAIPTFSLDYPRSPRNVAVSLAVRMLDGSQLVSEREIARLLRYLGMPCARVQAMVEKLFDSYVISGVEGAEAKAHDFLVVHSEREFSEDVQAIVEVKSFGLRERTRLAGCFRHVSSVPLITEHEDGTARRVAMRMLGLLWQSILPGQYVTLDGKYYEVMCVSAEDGVTLRRAADHFSRRHAYRQLRAYELASAAGDGLQEPVRKQVLNGVTIEVYSLNVSVSTSGYLDQNRRDDFFHAKLVEVADVPIRSYRGKETLVLSLPNLTPVAMRTLAVVMSELLVTLFPKEHQYVAVLTPGANDMPAGLLSKMMVNGLRLNEVENRLFVVEDSPVDLGAITCIERNIERILGICSDYLEWLTEPGDVLDVHAEGHTE